jgi:hypothetical protein
MDGRTFAEKSLQIGSTSTRDALTGSPRFPDWAWPFPAFFLCAAILMLAVANADAARSQSPRGAPGAARGAAASDATVVYRKVFKSSSPEFTEIRIPENGQATCDLRSLEEDSSPQAMEISAALRGRIFGLAADLHDFRDLSLDVKRRIANLGEKTFRYEKGGEASEVKFNYTLNAKAGQLLQIFEALTREQEDVLTLQRTMRYDRLGVNGALVQLDDDVHRHAVAQPERFLPLLEQIAGDAQYLEIARKRARALVDSIRSGSH